MMKSCFINTEGLVLILRLWLCLWIPLDYSYLGKCQVAIWWWIKQIHAHPSNAREPTVSSPWRRREEEINKAENTLCLPEVCALLRDPDMCSVSTITKAMGMQHHCKDGKSHLPKANCELNLKRRTQIYLAETGGRKMSQLKGTESRENKLFESSGRMTEG